MVDKMKLCGRLVEKTEVGTGVVEKAEGRLEGQPEDGREGQIYMLAAVEIEKADGRVVRRVLSKICWKSEQQEADSV